MKTYLSQLLSLYPTSIKFLSGSETEYLLDHSQELSKEAFIQDETLRRAFVRSIEIIGEATKKVPENFRQNIPTFSGGRWQA